MEQINAWYEEGVITQEEVEEMVTAFVWGIFWNVERVKVEEI